MDDNMTERIVEKTQESTSRRGFVKKMMYVAPVIATLAVFPSEARSGSQYSSQDQQPQHQHNWYCGHTSGSNSWQWWWK